MKLSSIEEVWSRMAPGRRKKNYVELKQRLRLPDGICVSLMLYTTPQEWGPLRLRHAAVELCFHVSGKPGV